MQYWTSRGFAYLDVNYRGSSGFSTTYRKAIYGRWGEVDVADVISGAKYLVEPWSGRPRAHRSTRR